MAITTPGLSEEMSKLKAELVGEFRTVKNEIIDLKEVIIQNLRNECNRLNNVVSEMSLEIVDLESKCNSLEQYGRRNNLEISGIPDSVDQTDLEDKFLLRLALIYQMMRLKLVVALASLRIIQKQQSFVWLIEKNASLLYLIGRSYALLTLAP